jgi:hypothetical protein
MLHPYAEDHIPAPPENPPGLEAELERRLLTWQWRLYIQYDGHRFVLRETPYKIP